MPLDPNSNPFISELRDTIEALVDAKITERFTLNPVFVDTTTVSFEQFENNYMARHEDNEGISHSFFRTFLRWMEQFYGYHLANDAEVIRAGTKISHIITGTYVAPDLSEYIGLSAVLNELFVRISGLGIPALEQRITDAEADILGLGADIVTINGSISGIQGGLTALQNNFNAHTANQAIHLIPDEVSILTVANKFAIAPAYVRGLFSGTAPIVYNNGAISLAIDANTLEIVGGALKVKEGVGGGGAYGLAYNINTHILSLVPNGGAPTVDLTSLLSGSIDLSNYIKKTGEATQTIQGNIIVTGTITAGGEITAYGS